MEREGADSLLTDFRPPKHDVLQVRALVDCGDVAVKWGGFRRINKGEIVSLSRVDAEPFILKGMASCMRARETERERERERERKRERDRESALAQKRRVSWSLRDCACARMRARVRAPSAQLTRKPCLLSPARTPRSLRR